MDEVRFPSERVEVKEVPLKSALVGIMCIHIL